MRVLVASNDLTFNVSLCEAYRALGCSVHAGLSEFWLDLNDYDLVHCHWPEELTDWDISAAGARREKALERLRALKGKSKLVCTVHNELPHADKTEVAADFYRQFYELMDRVGHFTAHSQKVVAARFPSIGPDAHVVHGMNDFTNLRALAVGKEAARSRLGIHVDDYVVATFGQLRSQEEMALFVEGTSGAAATLLFAARRPPPVGRVQRTLADRQFRRWVRRANVVATSGYLDDRMTVAIFEACDAMIVVRCANELNSGIVPLAMTFGTPLIAPRSGTFEVLLDGTMNQLYAKGNAESLRAAVQTMKFVDRDAVRHGNHDIAMQWGWDKALPRLLATL